MVRSIELLNGGTTIVDDADYRSRLSLAVETFK